MIERFVHGKEGHGFGFCRYLPEARGKRRIRVSRKPLRDNFRQNAVYHNSLILLMIDDNSATLRVASDLLARHGRGDRHQ